MAIKYIEVSATENGTYTDITDYIAFGGFVVQRNDVEDKDAGRSNVTGEMFRKRVATKSVWIVLASRSHKRRAKFCCPQSIQNMCMSTILIRKTVGALM